MARRILIIQGHPDPAPDHFGHALADAYAAGARAAGHPVRQIAIAGLDFPVLRTADEWSRGTVPPDIADAQEAMLWAEHLVIVWPLWLGGMPALLKAFLEQVFRPGFAIRGERARGEWTPLLKGRSAHILVTMGMPALIYRWYYRAHGLRSLERNILGFCGIGPIRETLVGSVEAASPARRQRHVDRLTQLGRQGR